MSTDRTSGLRRAALTVGAALVLVSCAQPKPEPARTPTSTSSSSSAAPPTPTPTPTPVATQQLPDAVGGEVVLDVPYVSQLHPVKASTGCEFAASLMLLRRLGWESGDLNAVLPHVIYHDSDPEKGFVGSVYEWVEGKPEVIHPKPLAKVLSHWGPAREIRERSIDGLIAELRDDNPVIVWITLYFQPPTYQPYQLNGRTIQQLWNTHTVVLAGYRPATDEFLILDPYDTEDNPYGQKYWISGDRFRRSWNARKLGLVVGEQVTSRLSGSD